MHVFTAIIERCAETGYYVGYVPNFPGAHTQAETLDELYANLQEVVEMLLETQTDLKQLRRGRQPAYALRLRGRL